MLNQNDQNGQIIPRNLPQLSGTDAAMNELNLKIGTLHERIKKLTEEINHYDVQKLIWWNNTSQLIRQAFGELIIKQAGELPLDSLESDIASNIEESIKHHTSSVKSELLRHLESIPAGAPLPGLLYLKLSPNDDQMLDHRFITVNANILLTLAQKINALLNERNICTIKKTELLNLRRDYDNNQEKAYDILSIEPSDMMMMPSSYCRYDNRYDRCAVNSQKNDIEARQLSSTLTEFIISGNNLSYMNAYIEGVNILFVLESAMKYIKMTVYPDNIPSILRKLEVNDTLYLRRLELENGGFTKLLLGERFAIRSA